MVPLLMATQHPDSTRLVGVYDEVNEAIEAFMKYMCDEVMIDYEGKLTPYHQVEWIIEKAFEHNVRIGEKLLLTPRVPNDSLEDFSRHTMAVMEAVLANVKAQRLGFRQPVKYVIIPMTENVRDSIRIQRRLYKIEKVMSEECGLDPTWFLLVVPLIETADKQVHSDMIAEAFHRALLKEVSLFVNEIRVFLGKSDSALLYGHAASSIALKIGLSRLHRWGEERFIDIKPILGTGKPPFRGHLTPENIDTWTNVWKGYSTVTIQSALRYNTSYDKYLHVVEKLKQTSNIKKPAIIDEDDEAKILRIVPKLSFSYRRYVVETVENLYSVFDVIPSTRERMQYTKYHRVIDGVKIPRAIKFVAGYYTIGLPPTLLDIPGLASLDDKEVELLLEVYPSIKLDLEHDLKYYSPLIAANYIQKQLIEEISGKLKVVADKLALDIPETDPSYHKLLGELAEKRGNPEESRKIVVKLAEYRGFLG